MSYLDVPMTDEQLAWAAEYFPKDRAIQELVQAIKDKQIGLGFIWDSTDFEGLRRQLQEHPSNHVIGYLRDKLFETIEYLEVENEQKIRAT